MFYAPLAYPGTNLAAALCFIFARAVDAHTCNGCGCATCVGAFALAAAAPRRHEGAPVTPP